MRRACVAHGGSSQDLEVANDSENVHGYNHKAKHRWPKTVAVPLTSIVFWGRYVTGSAFVLLLAHSVIFGNNSQQQQNISDYQLSSVRHSARIDADRTLHSISRAGDGLGRDLSASPGTHSSSSGTHSSGASRCGGHHTATNTLNSTLAFLFFTFVVCTIFYHFNMYVPFEWRFPISVVMFIGGGLIGLFFLYVTDDDAEEHRGNGFDTLIDGIQGAAAMDPHALLYIILPPLLYESASSMDWHVLRKLLPSSILLAVPGVMLNTFLTGCFVKLFVTIGSKSPKWEESWLLGSILSATDPVAVVAALAELGAPKKLSALVEGESLLNDGSAVVCAYVFLEWSSPADPDKYCEGHDGPGTSPSTLCVMGYFLQVAVCGALLGAAAGMILHFWLKFVRSLQLATVEIGIIFTAVYGTFYVAEALHTSGVLATVTLGFVMAAGGLHRMSHEARHNHHVNLSQVAYFCNQVAFFVAGIVSSRFMYSDKDSCDHSAASAQAWLELFGLYAVIHLTRGLVVLLFWPFLKRWGYGINWKEACIMVYGGLRGAVGLVMGLIVEHHKYVDPDVAQMVAFHTSGIVLLTLFINGSTIDGLYRRLEMYPHNQYRMTHLRKSLVKLEAECQKKGIKVIAKNWYFHDCSFKKILRCVPKFTHIRFNESDIPCADNIDSVKDTLRSLAGEAEHFKAKQPIYTYEEQHWSFGAKWRERKGEEFEKKIAELMNKTTNMVERKDMLEQVQNSGDKTLAYRPPDNRAQAGFYLSSRSAVDIQGQPDSEDREVSDDYSIEIEMVRTKDMQIIVGLLSSEEDLFHCQAGDEQVIGSICENSIGFNCHTCEVQYNGPCGAGEAAAEVPQSPLSSGDIVTIRFQRQPKGDWEVCFEVSDGEGSEPRLVISVPFGPFQPSELFPVVEFRYVDASRMAVFDFNKSRSLSTLKVVSNRFSLLPGAIAQESYEKATGVVEDTGKAVLQVAKAGIDAVTGMFRGTQRTEEEEVSRVPSSDARATAKVQLSFEPQLASDAESINELFHVLFNTVLHEYIEMHEHGIIGDNALAWLTEAVGAGLDCANQEVNAMRMAHFKSVGPGSPESNEQDLLHSISNKSLSNKLQSEAVQTMKQMFAHMRMDNVNKTIVGLFEPLIVEYLSLEHMVATPSWWDKLLRYTKRFAMLGFLSTRTKVECLWAFVEAHEEVLHESVCMNRFPDLVHCIHQLVEFAKNDLQILQEMQPRRYFYSKHILALRKIMNKRLLKLNKFAASGWMSPSDAGALLNELWSRILQADQFFPLLRSHQHNDAPTVASKVQAVHSNKSLSTGLLGCAENAWTDFEVPTISPKRRPPSDHQIVVVTPSPRFTAGEENMSLLQTPVSRSFSKGRSNPGGITVRVNRTQSDLLPPGHVETPMALSEMPAGLNDGLTIVTALTPMAQNASTPLAVRSASESSLDPKGPAPLSVVPTSSPPGVVSGDDLETTLNALDP